MADILDAAQKQINDAAAKQLDEKAVGDSPQNQPPAPPAAEPTSSDLPTPISTPPANPPAEPPPAPPTGGPDEVSAKVEASTKKEPPAETNLERLDTSIIDTLIKQSVEPANPPASGPPPLPKVTPLRESKKPRKTSKGVLLAMLFFLFITIPLSVFYVAQQRQLADLRSRAIDSRATDTCPLGTSCISVESCSARGGSPGESCDQRSRRKICCALSPTPSSSFTGCLTGSLCMHRDDCKREDGILGKSCGRADYVCCTLRTTRSSSSNQADTAFPEQSTPTVKKSGRCSVTNYSTSMAPVDCHYYGIDGKPSGTGKFQGMCAFYHCPSGCPQAGGCNDGTQDVWLEFGPCNSGKLGENECGQIDTVDNNRVYCAPIGSCDSKIQCEPTCQRSTPPGPQCHNIKIYKNNEVVDPTTLQPGDNVVLAVVGANATKGRLRINGGDWKVTTDKNNKGEFILDFTIPSGVTQFTIEAEVFKDGVWK